MWEGGSIYCKELLSCRAGRRTQDFNDAGGGARQACFPTCPPGLCRRAQGCLLGRVQSGVSFQEMTSGTLTPAQIAALLPGRSFPTALNIRTLSLRVNALLQDTSHNSQPPDCTLLALSFCFLVSHMLSTCLGLKWVWGSLGTLLTPVSLQFQTESSHVLYPAHQHLTCRFDTQEDQLIS